MFRDLDVRRFAIGMSSRGRCGPIRSLMVRTARKHYQIRIQIAPLTRKTLFIHKSPYLKPYNKPLPLTHLRHMPHDPPPLPTIHLLHIRNRQPRLPRPPHHLHRIRIRAQIQHRLTPQLIPRTPRRLRALPDLPRPILILPRRTRIVNQHHHPIPLWRVQRAPDRRELALPVVIEVARVGEFPAAAADAFAVGRDQVARHGCCGRFAGGAGQAAGHALG